MKLFERNTGKKIKTVAVIIFWGAIIYGISQIIIFMTQLYGILGYTGELVTISPYIYSLIAGILPIIVIALLSFPLYGFGKIVSNFENNSTENNENEPIVAPTTDEFNENKSEQE